MVNVTEAAQQEIKKLMEEQTPSVKGVRISADAISPLRANFRLSFVPEDEDTEGGEAVPFEGFNVFVDADSVPYAQDITLDFVEGLMGRGFKIENPNKIPPHLKGTIVEKIQNVVEEKINPSVAGHGGVVTLIDVKDNNVYLQFGGGCQGCGMIDVTLKQGVEVLIKEAAPEIEGVFDITDHADGKNPYYQEPA